MSNLHPQLAHWNILIVEFFHKYPNYGNFADYNLAKIMSLVLGLDYSCSWPRNGQF